MGCLNAALLDVSAGSFVAQYPLSETTMVVHAQAWLSEDVMSTVRRSARRRPAATASTQARHVGQLTAVCWTVLGQVQAWIGRGPVGRTVWAENSSRA